jgi:hypothetical protein
MLVTKFQAIAPPSRIDRAFIHGRATAEDHSNLTPKLRWMFYISWLPLCLLTVALTSTSSTPQNSALNEKKTAPSEQDAHPYHVGPPNGTLPAVLEPQDFTMPAVQNAYRIAGTLKEVLYQQPCYCHCGRYLAHTSLLDCYTSKHAAVCKICLQELFYAHEQTEKGKTPQQIRGGIFDGQWKAVDTAKYERSLQSH